MTIPALPRIPAIAAVFWLLIAISGPAWAGKPEDKSDKQDDSSSTSVDLKRQSTSNQSQSTSGGPLADNAGQGGSLFGAGEWQILGFGIGGTGHDTHNVTE